MFRKKSSWLRSIPLISCLCFAVLLFAVTASAQSKDDYQSGFAFGRENTAAIQNNLAELDKMAVANKTDMAAVMVKAYEAEAAYQRLVPEKVAWMRGIADGAGVDYAKILVFNSVDKSVTGFQGECTTLMAQGSAVAGGKGTIISKNRDVGANTLVEIGVHEKARHAEGEVYQAAYIDVPQVAETYKFIGSRSAGRWGYGMGINEHQVIVADNDAPSRDTLDFKQSLHDNDVIRLVLERAKTAREGVDIVAGLVEKHGQAWNGIMFEIGDPNELWIVEVTGHRWAAKRYVNTITARSNQYQIGDDYDLASKDLVSFAAAQKWVKGDAKKINFRSVYGTIEGYPENNDNFAQRPGVEKLYNTEMRYQRAMELLTGAQGKIDPQALMPMMRDHYDSYKLPSGKVIPMNQVPFYSSEYVDWLKREWIAEWPKQDKIETSMYIRGVCGHDLGWGATCNTAILVARPDVPNELGVMYQSFMQPCTSTFVPFYVGIDKVDPRYETPQAASVFHSISMRAFSGYNLYHDGIRAAFADYEKTLFADAQAMEAKYQDLKRQGRDAEALQLMNDFVAQKGDDALKAADNALDNMTKAAADASAWKKR